MQRRGLATWRALSPMPLARHDHGFVVNGDDVLFVFGGMGPEDSNEPPLWDTYRLESEGSWRKCPYQPSIESRGGFGSCILQDTAIVSGGYSPLSGDLSEQISLKTNQDGASWQSLADVDHDPRSGATLTAVGEDRAFLFGGFAAGVAVNDFFEINKGDNQLKWSAVQSVASQQPSGRSAHAAVSLGGGEDGFFLHGGFGEDGTLDDLWVFHRDRWQRLEPQGDVPVARSGHSLVALDKDQILLFGGVGGTGEAYNGLHIYSVSNNRWRVLEANAPPRPRYNHRAAMLRGSMVITGGCVDDGKGMLSVAAECFALDL